VLVSSDGDSAIGDPGSVEAWEVLRICNGRVTSIVGVVGETGSGGTGGYLGLEFDDQPR
jgi:hypothetical protein